MLKPYWETDKLEIYHGNSLDIMKQLDSNSVDLIVTSPPYNVGIDYGKGREADNIPINKYRELANESMLLMYRVLKEGGRLGINIGASGRDFPLNYIWQDAAYKADFMLRSEIVWPGTMKNPTAWGSYMSATDPWTIPNFEFIYFFSKGTHKRNRLDRETSPMTKQEWRKITMGVWKVKERKQSNFPAAFPLEIPRRIIKFLSFAGDTVLDPFLGSGTTLRACQQLNRIGIGIEKEERWCKLAKERLSQQILI